MSSEDRVYIALTEKQARWLLVVVENAIESYLNDGHAIALVTAREMADIEARLRVGIEER